MMGFAEFVGRLRHWQVFIAIGVPFIAAQLCLYPLLDTDLDFMSPGFDLARIQEITDQWTLANIPGFLFFLVWLWAIAVVANRRIAMAIRPEPKLINFMVPYVAAYFVFTALQTANAFQALDVPAPVSLILPLQLLATFGMIYVPIFCAKNLVMAERQQEVSFGSYVWPLFLLGIYPIGLWFIQPRVNALGSRDVAA